MNSKQLRRKIQGMADNGYLEKSNDAINGGHFWHVRIDNRTFKCATLKEVAQLIGVVVNADVLDYIAWDGNVWYIEN